MIRFNIFLLMILVVFALALVTSQHRARGAFQRLEAEQERGRELEIERGLLEIELSTLATPARVEKVAREQLRMDIPQSGNRAAGQGAGSKKMASKGEMAGGVP